MNKLNDSPKVYTIDNFISDEDCDHIINISKDKVKPSLVSGDKTGFISKGRSGQNCWLPHNFDAVTKKICKKIAKQVNIPLENAEQMQIIYYDTKQEYRQHYDGWLFDGSEKSRRNMKWGGQRMITALGYLNTVPEGGGTGFTKLKKEVKSDKGKLLVFSNVEEGKNARHELSEHAGRPVIEGEKWAFNLWFREKNTKKEYEYPIPLQETTEKEEPEKAHCNYKTVINDNKPIIDISDEKPTPVEKIVDQFPDTFLEVGDYFPFIKVGTRDLHAIVDDKYMLFICADEVTTVNLRLLQNLQNKYHVFVIYNTNLSNLKQSGICITSNTINNILKIPEKDLLIYIVSPNRKVVDLLERKNLDDLTGLDVSTYNTSSHIPYLVVENVLSPEFLDEILKFYDDNISKAKLHDSSGKNRLHVHPDRELEKKIDNKLSRSLFPEIKKIFYFDVKYRELYKIASYDAETNGRFHAHRDTPQPFQHRKYAMSLFLNDDYEGGEFELPEYNLKIKLKKNSALIFPGICSHKVHEVTKGSRKAMIAFFCSEIEGKTKGVDRYKVKSHFFDEKNVKYTSIYPQ